MTEWSDLPGQPALRVLVINLDRRPDRLAEFQRQFADLPVTLERVPAVDARDEPVGLARSLLLAAPAACWLSHQKALAIAAEGDGPALICEDDAALGSGTDWDDFLRRTPYTMQAAKLDVLQLGYITEMYGYEPRIGTLYARWAEFRQRARRMFRSPLGVLVLGEFRWGAHAYVVTPQAARALLGFNDPVFLPPDDFYMHLANEQGRSGLLRFARVDRSLIEQVSRTKASSELDTDLWA